MKIPLQHIEADLFLEIIGEREDSLVVVSEEEALRYGEAAFQLMEGCGYEYRFSNADYSLSDRHEIVSVSKFDRHKGRLETQIYVGTIVLEVIGNEGLAGTLQLEVRSKKADYRTEYREMLESITDQCTDLIMRIDSPVSQHFETNFDTGSNTLYQQFAFVKSVVDAQEFEEAVQKIISGPTTKWENQREDKDIRKIRRFGRKSIQQLVSKSERIVLSEAHYLNKHSPIHSVPQQIETILKTESTDTAENRFIKHTLESFLLFCENCEAKFEKYTRAKLEAQVLAGKLSGLLNQSFFKGISRPDFLKLNSTVLQRKSGYREVLKAWLKFDLAAKLAWQGGDNVYSAGKKDIATLYEYWVFFALLEIVNEVFSIAPKDIEQLIAFSKDKISLNLKQGKMIVLEGMYHSSGRNLHVRFCYNKSYGGGKPYPSAGSYTATLRPDYSLSFWPAGITAEEAELLESITHIHFDAKYKVEHFSELFKTPSEEELNEQKLTERKGDYQNADLLKMHAYKDAIRRTGGAYVLYPGKGQRDPFRGFHELTPGLGAFVLKPGKDQSGQEQLKAFIRKLTHQLLDRTSQSEKHSSMVYTIHKEPKEEKDLLLGMMPEFLDADRKQRLIPDETFVLVGYCTSNARLKWYEENQLYNFRMDDAKGALSFDQEVVNARYLLLRRSGKDSAADMYRITGKGPRVYSEEKLRQLGYPFSKHPKEFYLILEIEKLDAAVFGEASWNFKLLEKYQEMVKLYPGRGGKGMPFTVSLAELMRVRD